MIFKIIYGASPHVSLVEYGALTLSQYERARPVLASKNA